MGTEAKAKRSGHLFCVLATYHRIESLHATLQAITRQSRAPDTILVVDNGSDPSVRSLCRRFGARYIDARENLGPAGAFALAIQVVLEEAGSDSWLVTIGDDDPPVVEDRFERLWTFAAEMLQLDPRVAGIGSSGARYVGQSGRFERVPDTELSGPVRVDYLGGNQLFHRCEALRQVGGYDSSLFFGFEEADWGLRATRAGWSLYAYGDMWFEDRQRSNRLGIARGSTPVGTSSWRRYYSARNSTLLARRYANSHRAVALSALRGALGGTRAALRAGKPIREIAYPWRGALDGLRGRSGRTLNPPNANKLG